MEDALGCETGKVFESGCGSKAFVGLALTGFKPVGVKVKLVWAGSAGLASPVGAAWLPRGAQSRAAGAEPRPTCWCGEGDRQRPARLAKTLVGSCP